MNNEIKFEEEKLIIKLIFWGSSALAVILLITVFIKPELAAKISEKFAYLIVITFFLSYINYGILKKVDEKMELLGKKYTKIFSMYFGFFAGLGITLELWPLALVGFLIPSIFAIFYVIMRPSAEIIGEKLENKIIKTMRAPWERARNNFVTIAREFAKTCKEKIKNLEREYKIPPYEEVIPRDIKVSARRIIIPRSFRPGTTVAAPLIERYKDLKGKAESLAETGGTGAEGFLRDTVNMLLDLRIIISSMNRGINDYLSLLENAREAGRHADARYYMTCLGILRNYLDAINHFIDEAFLFIRICHVFVKEDASEFKRSLDDIFAEYGLQDSLENIRRIRENKHRIEERVEREIPERIPPHAPPHVPAHIPPRAAPHAPPHVPPHAPPHTPPHSLRSTSRNISDLLRNFRRTLHRRYFS